MTTFDAAVSFIHECWVNRNKVLPPPVYLIGPPGIGKTSVAREVHSRMGDGAFLEVKDLTSIPPEDVGGLPYREDGEVRYSPLSWMKRLCQPGARGVLVLDDLPAAGPAIAAAVRQIVLDRRIHDSILSPDVVVIVTGNRREDAAGAMVLPSHFRNSVCIIELEPEFKSWSSWFMRRGGDPTIFGFLNWKPHAFSTLPSASDKKGVFATPRTWAMLSDHLETARRMNCVDIVVAGYVGDGHAVEFAAYVQTVAGLPSAEDVCQNPQAFIPDPKVIMDTPDKLVCMTTSIAFWTAKRVNELMYAPGAPFILRNAPAIDQVAKMFVALCWVTQGRGDLICSAATTFKISGGATDALKLGIKQAELDPVSGPVLKQIAEALRD